MKKSTIFSVGHGNKSTGQLLAELKAHGIEYVMDVRSKPYSRHNPQFNRQVLETMLETHNITYLYLGDQLGGLPDDPACYRDGKVDYDLLKEKDFFREGLERLITAGRKGLKVAVLCSESDPAQCHRSKLIGQELMQHGIVTNHILSEDRIKTQVTVINELTKGAGDTDLFGNKVNFTSRKKYE